jgi:hypothetical protein
MITDYGVKGLIGAGLRASPTPMSAAVEALARNVDSQVPAGQSERLDFLGAVPAFREWIASRQAKKVVQQFHTAVLKKFESTADIPLDLIRNDKTGQVSEIAGGLVQRKRNWKDKLIVDLLNNGAGTTQVCFDGLSFFNGSHTWNGQSYNNSLTHAAATGTTPTANEAADAICEAIQALYSFVDDQGEPLNEGMTSLTIVTNTTIGNGVLQAVKQSKLDTGSGTKDNPVMGWTSANGLSINVIITPRYTTSAGMVMINSSPTACPLVFIENSGEAMVTSKAAGSDYEHDNDAWQYGVKAVGVGAYGRFTDAILMTFT